MDKGGKKGGKRYPGFTRGGRVKRAFKMLTIGMCVYRGIQ